MRGVIFAGGELGEISHFEKEDDDIIICADIGFKHCKALGLKPDVLLGDFDSSQMPDTDNAEILTFKSEKDETDTFLAVDYALKKGCGKIIIFGALGGRTDHELCNIFLLKYILDAGAEGVIEGGKNKIMIMDKYMRIPRAGSEYVSLLPLFGDVRGVTLHGMKYPLDNYYMSIADPIGVSNCVVEEYGEIFIESGYLAVFLCND